MTTVVLRPDDQITTHDGFGGTSWTYSSAGSNDGAADLADNSDSTFWYNGSPHPDGHEHAIFAFTTFTLPADARIISVQMRVRLDFAAAVTVSAWDQVGAGGQRFVGDLIGPAGLGTYGLNTKTDSPSFVAWTQADINELRITFEKVSGTGTGPKLIEVYADVVYNTLSVPTSVTVGPQVREDVPVAWTFTDVDVGDTQTAYHAKVFTSTVVNGGGFNPASSATVYDTGFVSSAAGSATLNANLSPGRYFVYVATYDSGTNERSGWVGSNEFRVVNSPLMMA